MISNGELDASIAAPALGIEVPEPASNGPLRVVVTGSLSRATATRLYTKLDQLSKQPTLTGVELQCSALQAIDSAGAAVLSVFAQRLFAQGIPFRVTHLSEPLGRVLSIMPRPSDAPRSAARDETTLESLGGYGFDGWSGLKQFYATFTDAALAGLRALGGKHPPSGAFTSQAVRIGVDALPIVGLLSFLLGLVLAFQSAEQLRTFGAEIYTANLVGIGMFREFGPLLTGIVLAGRSGSSIAAELGTMKVNEEVDALHAMGIDHARFLVLPRLLALVVVQPALTLISSIVGTVGGLLIGILYLKISASGYLNQSLDAIRIFDLVQGMSKSVVFALLIGQIACFSGLSVSGGSAQVGRATTRAVVAGIFMIIVADSVFTTISTLWP